MSQDVHFCAVCALLRLDRYEHPGLVLAALPLRDTRLTTDPLCSHHRRMLHIAPVEGPVLDRTGAPLTHYNGTPVLQIIEWQQRAFLDQLDIIDLVTGTPNDGHDGLLNYLRRRLRLWQWEQWMHDHIDDQTTTILPPTEAARQEQAASDRLFERITGYLALQAAGLDSEPVMIEDDSNDRSSGEE